MGWYLSQDSDHKCKWCKKIVEAGEKMYFLGEDESGTPIVSHAGCQWRQDDLERSA
jgi:hypothetical protein